MLGCSSPICQGEGGVNPVPLCSGTRGSTKSPMPLLVLGKAPSPPRRHRPQPGHQVLRPPPQRCCTSWRSNEPGAATDLTAGQTRAQHLPGAMGAQSQASSLPADSRPLCRRDGPSDLPGLVSQVATRSPQIAHITSTLLWAQPFPQPQGTKEESGSGPACHEL